MGKSATIHVFGATLMSKYSGLGDKVDARLEFKAPGLKNKLSGVKTKVHNDAGKHPEFNETLEALSLSGDKGIEVKLVDVDILKNDTVGVSFIPHAHLLFGIYAGDTGEFLTICEDVGDKVIGKPVGTIRIRITLDEE